MNQDLLKQLLALMDEGRLTELEYETEDARVRFSRRQDWVAGPGSLPGPAVPTEAPPSAGESGGEASSEPQEESGTILFRAPMVGTFYRAPSPDGDPYVEVGDRVGKETVLCILEAMKVMNEVKADCSGEVLEILAENGEAVEFGQPLFRIRSS